VLAKCKGLQYFVLKQVAPGLGASHEGSLADIHATA
jgi:hypothetical protein